MDVVKTFQPSEAFAIGARQYDPAPIASGSVSLKRHLGCISELSANYADRFELNHVSQTSAYECLKETGVVSAPVTSRRMRHGLGRQALQEVSPATRRAGSGWG